jgi:hypothetical protein
MRLCHSMERIISGLSSTMLLIVISPPLRFGAAARACSIRRQIAFDIDVTGPIEDLGHRIILLCGRFADPFGNTVGDELARMLKRDDVRAVARRFFIADRQHCAAAM